MTNSSRAPCCDEEKFPFKPKVFNQCLPEMISSLYKSPRYIFVPGNAGPKFELSSSSRFDLPIARALIIEYESTQPFTTSYIQITNFSNHINNWFSNILKIAPPSLQNGWFISELSFNDLQENLLSGTMIDASIAMISSLIVLLLLTMNILISLYAVLSVIFTILTTISILVLLQWKLNILESIAVSTAIGLGIDFVLHYALNYQQCEKNDRRISTEFALSRMIGPTIMAALTTFIAGVFMIFSNILAYIQIGLFLVIVITMSWLHATFFFASLLYAFGPHDKRNDDDKDEINLRSGIRLIKKSENHELN